MNFLDKKNELFVTKIVLACFVKPGNGSLIHTNRSSYGIAYNLSGKKTYNFSSGEKLTVEDGDVIFLPFGSSYVIDNTVDGDCYAINFILSNQIDYAPFLIHSKSKDSLLPCFIKAVSSFQKQEYGFNEKCLRELYDILYKIKQINYKTTYNSPNQKKILSTATAYICENYTFKNITIKEICDKCSISDTYLRRIFNSEFGISPIEYINRLRLNYAKSLIASGDYSVSDACFMSGFNDTSYFSRTYKKHFGFPPKETKYI